MIVKQVQALVEIVREASPRESNDCVTRFVESNESSTCLIVPKTSPSPKSSHGNLSFFGDDISDFEKIDFLAHGRFWGVPSPWAG